MRTICCVVGARPEFIQAAPLLRVIESHRRHSDCSVESVLVHTGQHYNYNMSKIFFDELRLKEPTCHLGVGSGSRSYQISETIRRMEKALLELRPNVVVVFGDTNSTFGSSFAASLCQAKVFHVEAGVRSYNKSMAEEVNRVLTDHIVDVHLCPSKTAIMNLEKEGISKSVYFVGDVMYDAVLENIGKAKDVGILQTLNLIPRRYCVATIHRAENTDNVERLKAILSGLEEIATTMLPVVLPLHPRTSRVLSEIGLRLTKTKVIKPVSYLEMLCLEKESCMIMTDSGGMQKEAFYLKIPCVTLREETEWVETVESGWNILAGTSKEGIVSAARNRTRALGQSAHIYGDGHAADKILSILLSEM